MADGTVPEPRGPRAPRPLHWLPAIAVSAFAVAGGAAAAYAPPATGEVAVVFPFGTSDIAAYRLIVAAGGRFVAPSHLPNVVVAYAMDAAFGERVRAAGAWMLVAAHGLCGAENEAGL